MTEQHPITPPPELVSDWRLAPEYTDGLGKLTMVTITVDRLQYIATQAARWGADQQLEQCEKYWMTHGISPEGVVAMRYALRPKPPSLKEQALALIDECTDPQTGLLDGDYLGDSALATIRRALEQLDD